MIRIKKIQLILKANTQWTQDKHQYKKFQIVEGQSELISFLQILMVEQTILQQRKDYRQ